MSKLTPVVIDDYEWLLDNRIPFTQANYGDGEWSCIIGRGGENAQGGRYTPELRAGLVESLLEPRLTYYGTNPGRRIRDEVNRWIIEEAGPGLVWVFKEILPNANLHGELGRVIAALRRRTVIIVGPPHLRTSTGRGGRPSLVDMLRPVAFVEVPLPGAQGLIGRTVESVRRLLDKYPDAVVSFSSGMATNVAMHRLSALAAGAATMIDFGACWDPYAGEFSRKGYRKEKFQTAMDVNIAVGTADEAEGGK